MAATSSFFQELTLILEALMAAADLVLGMGSSALRALAIARPLIVQGELGFSEVFEPATSEMFMRQGFYGLGDGSAGSDRLAAQIESRS